MSTPLAIDLIRTDGGTQSRVELSQDVVDDYAEKWEAGCTFPDIDVFHDGSDYWPSDGFHRLFGAIKAKRASINATVRRGTQRDALLASAGANTIHGLRRSNEDKRKAVTTLLSDKEWVTWSDRKIADHVSVSVQTVSNIRTELSKIDSSPAAKTKGQPRKGKDGKTRRPRASKPKAAPAVHHREPGDESEPTGEDPVSTPSIILDEIDREVPDELLNCHGLAAQIKSAATQFDQLKKTIKTLSELPGGAFIPLQQVEIALKDTKSLVSHARYYTECPRCKGKPKDSCDRCDGHGFLPYSRRGTLSIEDKAWLGIKEE